MADNSGPVPHELHGGEKYPSSSMMPGPLPNGAVSQWGTTSDYKTSSSSQGASPGNASNGLRNLSQLNHPGSLSSHSSRDSSPSSSRIGVVHPSVWSPTYVQNHHNPGASYNPALSQNSFPTSIPSGGPSAVSGANQPLPGVGMSAPVSTLQSSVGARTNLVGQLPAQPQQMPSSSGAPAAPQPPHPILGASAAAPGQTFLNASSNVIPQSSSHSIVGNMSSSNSLPPGLQSQGVTSSNNSLSNNAALPKYSQAPSNLPVAGGNLQNSSSGIQRQMDQTFNMQASGRVAPASQAPHQPSSRQPLQAPQEAPSVLGQAQPNRHMPFVPPGPGPHFSPGAGQQGNSGPLSHLSSGPDKSLQSASVQQLPLGLGQQMPTATSHQMPSASRPSMSSHGPQMQPTSGQSTMNFQPTPTSSGFSQAPTIFQGPNMPPRQVPVGSVLPMQAPPRQMSHGPWSAAPAENNTMQRPPYPMQQNVLAPPPGVQSFNSNQPSNIPTLAPPNQMLSGPTPQRHPQTITQGLQGQYLPNQTVHQPVHQQGTDVGFRRYPQQMHPAADSLTTPMSNMSVTQAGYNKLWGQEHYDLLQSRNILPHEKVEVPKIRLAGDFQNSINCSPDIFRCTLTKIPETDSLLKKSRLPLGVLIHPFMDINNLPVIQCTPIVRCRVCRTYINPFVYFMDEKHWKCNLCFRVNELPDEFHFDPATKTYGEPMRRPEVKSATIEFIAPAEYMLRPPQPAVYLFLFDVSRLAVDSGYLQLVCETLLSELDHLPGDSRTSVGFITYDSSVHFYSLAEGLSAPQQMVVMDIDDVFLPCPENLLANLGERKELIQNLLALLPTKFAETYDTGSALGAALQAAFKLMSPTGGRVTVFQCCLPNKGPGSLKAREDPANRASKDVPHLNPATDFYKQLALEFSGQQTAVDLFLLNQQYSDLATISGVSRFSGGCIYHYPLFQSSNILLSESFESGFRRYLERKIGFEAVMRIRCSRGLSIHTFHGNFYVRSTDLLSLPNINPDAGFGMQVSIEENLSDMQNVCFQAALLYTSGKGERRIRVHTLCLPIAASLPDILHSADQQCIIGLLAKMAVDRSQQSSLSDARDAFINVVIDALSAYKLTQSSVVGAGLIAPKSLRLLPLYILALLKNIAFRSGTNTRLDDRVFAMCQMKTLPLNSLIQFIYPDLYPVHSLDQYEEVMVEEMPVSVPPRLHLSAEKISSQGAFLLDAGDQILLFVGRAISPMFCENVLGVSSFSAIPEDMFELPEIDCEDSCRLRNFVTFLQAEKPHCATLHVIREDSKLRSKFFDRLVEDRTDSSLSYYEFLQHIKNQIK